VGEDEREGVRMKGVGGDERGWMGMKGGGWG